MAEEWETPRFGDIVKADWQWLHPHDGSWVPADCAIGNATGEPHRWRRPRRAEDLAQLTVPPLTALHVGGPHDGRMVKVRGLGAEWPKAHRVDVPRLVMVDGKGRWVMDAFEYKLVWAGDDFSIPIYVESNTPVPLNADVKIADDELSVLPPQLRNLPPGPKWPDTPFGRYLQSNDDTLREILSAPSALSIAAREAIDSLPPLPGGFERKVLACAHCPGSERIDLTAEPPEPPKFWAINHAPAPHGWGADQVSTRVIAWVKAHAGCGGDRKPAHAGWVD